MDIEKGVGIGEELEEKGEEMCHGLNRIVRGVERCRGGRKARRT
jgi:hypothetical protein